MMDLLHEKFERLKVYIKNLESVAVCFSGGVDSTFLVYVAHEVLGERMAAITARSSTFPEREFKETSAFALSYGIRHIVCTSEELYIDGFSQNPINRCYLCKKELFSKIKKIAQENHIQYIAEGSNMDDNGDYRPGLIAVEEFGVKSPLRYAMLTKHDIRQLSKEMGLPTWQKPSFACLSSRFPYGEEITLEKLKMVDKAEQFLLDLGFGQIRVRHHGNLARLEIDEEDFSSLLDKKMRLQVYTKLKEIGFTYISLDLQGYRTGSMNETFLPADKA